MTRAVAEVVVAAFTLYVAAGVTFAAVFLPRALARLDPRVRDAPVGLRLLILLGVAALWPIWARRWATGRGAPLERNAHRTAAGRVPGSAAPDARRDATEVTP